MCVNILKFFKYGLVMKFYQIKFQIESAILKRIRSFIYDVDTLIFGLRINYFYLDILN